MGPTDFATIYDVGPLWSIGLDGTGQTIAVVGETDINPQDVASFRTMFGLPANQPNFIWNGPDPGILSDGEEGESDLDVEWSGAVAKGAIIDFVISQSTETSAGIDLSALYIVDNNLAPVMSESYGACEAKLGAGGNQFYNALWEQAASQGITVLLSSGDSGSAGCDSVELGEVAAQSGLAVSGLASTPFNVAVGGTDLNLTQSNISTYWSQTNSIPSESSAKSYIPETTWNFSCADTVYLTGCTPPPNTSYLDEGVYLIAGGGGSSGVSSKPSWQSGTGVPNDSARDIPDVSLLADGYVTCQMDANGVAGGDLYSCDLNAPYLDLQIVGGTSASVQAFAGIMALVNQRYGRQGNANYVMYPMAARTGASCNSSTAPATNSSCLFYDTTVGNNSVICALGTPDCSATSAPYGVLAYEGAPAYPATTGYDLATGLGTVNVANLVNNWKSSFSPSSTSLSLSTTPATNPITLTHGQPINFTVNVTSGSGTPTGDVSLIAQAGSSVTKVTGIGSFTLGGGSVSNSTDMLPGGSYNVTAHYAGNGTFAASDSSPGIPVSVGQESSQAKVQLISCNFNTGACANGVTSMVYGSTPGILLLRTDVTNASGQPCSSPSNSLITYPCPTGTVTTTLNGQPPSDAGNPAGSTPGTYLLNSQGYAEDQFIQLSGGTYSVVSSYAGDNSYKSSTSPTVPLTITKAPTTITFTGLPTSAVGLLTNPLNVTVNTTSYGAAPTGILQFLLNGSTVIPAGGDILPTRGSATSYASLYGSLQPSLPIGISTVAAQYVGDNNYAGSTSAAVSISITDFSLSANPATVNVSAPGQTGTATLTITPLYGFTGSVELFTGNCPTGGTCTITPSTVNVTGSSPVTATLSIATTANVNPKLRTPQPKIPWRFHLPIAWPWLLVGLLALAALTSLTVTKTRPALWLFVMALLVAGAWVACGGAGGGGGGTSGGGAGGSGTGGGGSNPPSGPLVKLLPASLTFSQENLGVTSAAQSSTLSNAGNADLNFTTMAFGGANPQDFAQTSNCGSKIAAGASCAITATFTPSAGGRGLRCW